MGRRRQDHWARRAKSDGYRARSVYKLEEIQDKYALIPRKGGRVLDLGCSPGSWSEFVSQRVGRGCRLVGVDLAPVDAFPGSFVQASVFDLQTERLLELLGGPADLVMSDMAPSTSGDRFADHVNQLELASRGLDLAGSLLRPGGNMVVKVFAGQDEPDFVERTRTLFRTVKRVVPKATRKESVELFVVGLSRRT
ncbi:MAG: RlmE family RNA methyltransferase [Myxococcota bacterium]|nr:RlmE family RNA methyltransferase [Myxococcota bacterium]